MKFLARAGAALVIAGAAWLFAAAGAQAADHRDSPGPKGLLAADITDVYAFRSPANAANLVVALNVNPRLPGEARTSYFSNNVKYIVHVVSCAATAASATTVTPDINITATFSGSGATQAFSISGLTTTAITGTVKQNVSAASGAIQIYCGPRDDPFYFDLDAFKHFTSGPYTPTEGLRRASDPDSTLRPPVKDFFAGSDVSAIILEFPITAVTSCTENSGTLKAWAETMKVTGSSSKAFITNPIR